MITNGSKRSEEVTRAEVDKAQNYLDIAGTIIVAINADQTVSLINKAGCQIFGYSEDEIIGKNWFDNFLPENIRDEVRSVFDNILTSQNVETTGYLENYILAKDGKIKLIAWNNSILRDNSGNFIGTLSSGMDITERMRMEEQIRWNAQVNESLAELYKPLISASSMKEIADTILAQAQKLTGSKHGYVSSIDPVTGDNVGHTLTDMMGDACHVDDENKRIAFPKGSDGHYRVLFGHSLNTGESFFTNSPTTHPSSSGVPEGHIPLGRFLSVPVMLDEKLVGQIALANSNGDYTDKDLDAIKRLAEYYALAIQRMRMEEKLVTNEARYRNIIAQAGGVAYQRDWQNGTYAFMDDGIKHLTGYSSDEMTPELLEGLVDQDIYNKTTRSKISQQIGGDTATLFQGECRIKTKDGQIKFVSDSSIELRDTDGGLIQTLGMLQDITQRKQAEDMIKESEEKYRTLVSYSSNPIFSFNRDETYRFVNEAFATPFNKTPEEIIGKTPHSIFSHEEAEKRLTVVRHVYNTGEKKEIEVKVETSSGEVKYYLTMVDPIKDESGTILWVSCISKDITERKQAEALLIKNEEKYRALVESLPDVIMRFDRNARHIYVSKSVTKDIGMLPEQFLDKTHRELGFPDELSTYWEQAINSVFDIGKTIENEFEFDGINGPITYNWRLVPEINESGNVVSVLSIARDITEHRKSEKSYQDMFNSMINGFTLLEIICDESGKPVNSRFIDVNPAFEKLTGLNRDLVIGNKVSDVWWGQEPYGTVDVWHEQEPYGIDTYGKVALTGEPIHFENYSKELGRYFEVSVYSPQNGQYAAIFSDITDRKQAEILQEKLQQTSKMESIGRLAGGIAHDFNNLLTVIQGSASLSLRDLSKNDPIYDRLKMILESSERAADLTRQLLAFSRKQIIEMKVINLNNLVNNLRKMLVRLIGEDIELKTMLASGLGNINADIGQIEQVIVNLAVNARDAMPNGGKLSIYTDNVELDEAYCKIHLNNQPGKYVMLMVSDNGIGMDNETKEHIFEPFFTTKGVGEGTGLGLATVYGIVKQHNGSIEFYSELGHGTAFKIYLPIVEGEVSIQPKESKKIEMPTGNETILVVEDEDIVREMVAEFLSSLGYNVLTAENGGMALMIAEQRKGKIQLMLTDVVMPNMNGHQLAERLQREHPEIKVLYTSGYTQDIIVHDGILDSGLNFIGKPYMFQSLAKKLRDLLDA